MRDRDRLFPGQWRRGYGKRRRVIWQSIPALRAAIVLLHKNLFAEPPAPVRSIARDRAESNLSLSIQSLEYPATLFCAEAGSIIRNHPFPASSGPGGSTKAWLERFFPKQPGRFRPTLF